MSSYVQVYVKLNCEKSLNAIDVIFENGGIDEIVVVGDYDENTKSEFENQYIDDCGEDISYLSDNEWLEEVEDGTLPQVSFDGYYIGYEKLLELHNKDELDQYFT